MAGDSTKRLGRYVLKSLLGRGGMGTVYRAEDTRLNRDVALKILPQRLAADGNAVERFLREARAAARLNHPNVVAVLDVDQEAGRTFLVMELVRGDNLQSLLGNGPFLWQDATRIIADCCDGLAAAHGEGLIHRDVKPGNILWTSDGRAKLADFGLARALDGEETNALTSTGSLLGTPHYMSPEQCQGETLDPRSDLYSLGATYFALLVGRPPFTQTQPLQLMFAHCSAPVPDPRSLRSEIPKECAAIVLKALAKQPADRFDSAASMGQALRAALAKYDLEAAPPPNPKPVAATSAETRTSGSGKRSGRTVRPQNETDHRPTPHRGPRLRAGLWAGAAFLVLYVTGWRLLPIGSRGDGRSEQREASTTVPVRQIVPSESPRSDSTRAAFGPDSARGVAESAGESSGQTETSRPAGSSEPVVRLVYEQGWPALESEVLGLDFSPEGTSLALVSRKGSLAVMDLARDAGPREILWEPEPLHAVACGRFWTALGGAAGVVWLVSPSEPARQIRLEQLSRPILSLAQNSRGDRLAVGTEGSLELYSLDTQGGHRLRTLATLDPNGAISAYMVYCVTFSADDRLLGATSWNQAVGIWNADDGRLLHSRRDAGPEVISLAFLPGSETAVLGCKYQAGISTWDYSVLESPFRRLAAARDRTVRALAPLGPSLVLAHGEWDGPLFLYDVSADREQGTFQKATGMSANALAISRAGTRLATGGGHADKPGGYVQLWSISPTREGARR
ncbi:MAG: WD40 repeat domain-containing serine/threonine protein kinase [Planctomycetaceae bacterium]